MGRSRRTFFYDRSSSTNEHLIIDEDDYEDDDYLEDDEPKFKPRTVYESMGVITQQLKRQEETSKKPKKTKHRCNKQSDRVIQMILQTTKLLEGRFTFSEILAMDIPTCKRIIDNEMYNIETSIVKFQKTGKINAYTRNELSKTNDEYMRGLNDTLTSALHKK